MNFCVSLRKSSSRDDASAHRELAQRSTTRTIEPGNRSDPRIAAQWQEVGARSRFADAPKVAEFNPGRVRSLVRDGQRGSTSHGAQSAGGEVPNPHRVELIAQCFGFNREDRAD